MRLPVAAIGMNVYITILEEEKNNAEIISIVLEILDAVLRDDTISDEGHLSSVLGSVLLVASVTLNIFTVLNGLHTSKSLF